MNTTIKILNTISLRSADPVRAGSSFDPCSLCPITPTMATPTGPPIFIPQMNSYWEYFARAETNTFRGHYFAVLVQYSIDPVDANANAPLFLQRLLRPLSTLVSLRERARHYILSTTTWRTLTARHSLVRTWHVLIARHSLVRTDRALSAHQSLERHHTHLSSS